MLIDRSRNHYPNNIKESSMFKSFNGLSKDNASHIASRCDRSIIFKETLLDAAISNEFGFKEPDILPLFVKYQSKRQILINIFSFLTYVVQLPTRFYLRRLQNSNFVSNNNRNSQASCWLGCFKTIGYR